MNTNLISSSRDIFSGALNMSRTFFSSVSKQCQDAASMLSYPFRPIRFYEKIERKVSLMVVVSKYCSIAAKICFLFNPFVRSISPFCCPSDFCTYHFYILRSWPICVDQSSVFALILLIKMRFH